MKYTTHIVATLGLVFVVSGCTSSSQSQMDSLNSNACKNSKCQCPKPCKCGSGCRCGMKGNSDSMNGAK